MGKSHKEWKEVIAGLCANDAKKLSEALETLKQWEFFKEQYEWTGLFTIQAMIDVHIKFTLPSETKFAVGYYLKKEGHLSKPLDTEPEAYAFMAALQENPECISYHLYRR